jgi:hypothetical protein
MKRAKQVIVFAALLAGIAALSSLRRSADSGSIAPTSGPCCPLMALSDEKPAPSVTDSATNQPATNTISRQVIAYYFHGTVRCDTCLLIEA